MLQELSVNYHVIRLHTHVLVLYVFSPETIVIVKVVYRLDVCYLLWNSLDFVNLSVGLAVKVCHTALDFWLDLKVCNVHLLFEDA
jgi:hypothetical protein